MALCPCGFPPYNISHQSNYEKIPDKSQLKDILQNIWPALCKILKVTKNKKSLRNCYNQEGHDKLI